MKGIHPLVFALLMLSCHSQGVVSDSDNVDTLHLKSCKAQGFDRGDTPNESGHDIFEKLDDESTSKEDIYAYFSHYGIRYPEPIEWGGMMIEYMEARITPRTIWTPSLVILFTALLVSIWPAYRAARVVPVKALRDG